MRSLVLPSLLVLLAIAAPHARGQSSPCLPSDSGSAHLLQYVTGIISSSDARGETLRTALGVNNVNVAQVSLITSGTDCTKARQAVDALANTPNSNRRMYVVKVGSKRLFVRDENAKAGEYAPVLVFDNKWVFIQSLLAG